MGTSFLNGESLYYMTFNRSKKGITLNLRTPEGREVFSHLVRVSDVVLDNFRPGVTARLGVDFDTLKEINSTIVCCSVSGYGADGPYSARPVFDSVVQALSGAMSVHRRARRRARGNGVRGDGHWWRLRRHGRRAGGAPRPRADRDGPLGRPEPLGHPAHLPGPPDRGVPGTGSPYPRPGARSSLPTCPMALSRPATASTCRYTAPPRSSTRSLPPGFRRASPSWRDCPWDERFNTMEGRRKNWAELKAVLAGAFATRTAGEWMDALGRKGFPSRR